MSSPNLHLVAAAGLLLLGCASAPLDGRDAGAQSDTPGSGGGAGASGDAGAQAGSDAGSAAPEAGAVLPTIVPPTGADFAPVDYPSGPYGTRIGSVIENFTFIGWRRPADAAYDLAELETLSLADFYNPHGEKGPMKLLAVNASAVWCAVCQSEYHQMLNDDTYATYREKGVEILGTLFQDRNYGPSQPTDLKNWAGNPLFLVEFPFVLDPGFKLGAFFASDATPLNMVVDLRTMEIRYLMMGYNPSTFWSEMDRLLAEP
jgi:hypothetical protein